MTNLPMIHEITLGKITTKKKKGIKKSPSLVTPPPILLRRILPIPLKILDHFLMGAPRANPGSRRIQRIPSILAGIQDRNGVRKGCHNLCN